MATVQRQEFADVSARDLRHLDPRTEERLRDLGATMMPFNRLKRTGGAPFLFNGTTLATVCGVTPALPFWYELNLHRTVIGTFVTDVRLFHKTGDLRDLFRVVEHDDLDAAIAWFERYAPADDVVVPQDLVRPPSAAALALSAAKLELHIDQLCGQYRAVLGELLYALVPAQ